MKRLKLVAAAAVLAVALLLSAAAWRAGLPPDGYYISTRDLAVLLPSAVVDTGGAYKMRIERMFAGPKEERLLRTAEAVYPPRDSLVTAIGRVPFSLDVVPEVEDLWWASEFDGVRIPYALTGRAVLYYLDLSRAYQRGDFHGAGTTRMLRSSLWYKSTIERLSTYEREGRQFEDVYVANLRVQWYHYCGSLCALRIDMERIVVLSPEATVLAVFGDGQVRGGVS